MGRGVLYVSLQVFLISPQPAEHLGFVHPIRRQHGRCKMKTESCLEKQTLAPVLVNHPEKIIRNVYANNSNYSQIRRKPQTAALQQ